MATINPYNDQLKQGKAAAKFGQTVPTYTQPTTAQMPMVTDTGSQNVPYSQYIKTTTPKDTVKDAYWNAVQRYKQLGIDDPEYYTWLSERPIGEIMYRDPLDIYFKEKQMSALSESLQPYKEKAFETAKGKLSAMGRLGGGLQKEAESDIESQYFGLLADEAQRLSSETTQDYLQKSELDLDRAIKDYISNIQDIYGQESFDIEKYLTRHGGETNRAISDWAASQGYDVSDILSNIDLDIQQYQDTVNAIGQLIQSGAYALPSYLQGAPKLPLGPGY